MNRMRKYAMHCNHSVKTFEWEKCPKCGKIVRRNRWHDATCFILMAFFTYTVLPHIADWGVQVLNLQKQDTHNVCHCVIGCLVIIPFYLIVDWILPKYNIKK